MLMEDAFVLRDGDALARLFLEGGILVAGAIEVRGRAAITGAAEALWQEAANYVAGPHRVLQSRDLALLVGNGSISVSQRDRDRSWKFAISVLHTDQSIYGG